MSLHKKENYCRGVVICHGKSEWHMSRYIASNLHLNIRSYAKDKGRHSIQITGLPELLRSKPFDKPTSFAAEFAVEEIGKGKNRRFNKFKLFIIMDTDDCTEQQKQDFLSKKLFEGHWLCEYIVPIADSPCLEDVLEEAGLLTGKLRHGEKGDYYAKIFPINDKPLSDDTLLEVTTLRNKVQRGRHSNLSEYIDYCLSLAVTY